MNDKWLKLHTKMSDQLNRSLPGLGAVLMVVLASITSSEGGCTFPEEWSGRWFQHGFPTPLLINRTHIETKGECYEEQSDDIIKYVVYDKSENCYRCMAIHSKHITVLQYKETYCDGSLQDLCIKISGDAPLYSMFRKHPEAKPVPCPFKSAPFTFSYNKGPGDDCAFPPSKAESCTDDSRLVLKYQACPDIPNTESSVEELVCIATWRDGSSRYLLGKISTGSRRTLTSDEDQYRCFIYQRREENGKTVYNMAQSGDATCSGIQNAFEGSRTMKFITVDNHHNRCRFPVWITDHHTWLSLDHKKMYKFSLRNATLKIVDEEPKPNRFLQQNYIQPFSFQQNGFESQDQRRQNSEMRVVCHNILQSLEQKRVQIVAHITAGCNSGYVCMMFYKRDSNVIELQQTESYEENPDDACTNFDPTTAPYTTLITPGLYPKKCPHRGRFTVINSTGGGTLSRKRRQQPNVDNNSGQTINCQKQDYEGLVIGCNGAQELMEFKSSCAQQAFNTFSCLGNWQENNTYYVITSPLSRKSSDVRYCFIYEVQGSSQTIRLMEGGLGRSTRPSILRLSSVSETCHRDTIPGVTGTWAYNFTSNGTCAEIGNADVGNLIMPSLLQIILAALIVTSR